MTAAPRLDVGSGAGLPGSTASVEIVVTRNANTIGAASTDLRFDSSKFGISPATACTLNAAIAASPFLLTAGKVCSNATHACTVDADCTGSGAPPCNVVRLGVIPSSGSPSIAGDGTLITCTFSISAAAAPGLATLTNLSHQTFDLIGDPIYGTGGADGSITVIGATATPNTPAATATITPTVPAATPSLTPTASPSPALPTLTPSPTSTSTQTPTETGTSSPTSTPSNSPTQTPTNSATNSPTPTNSQPLGPTTSPTPTQTPSGALTGQVPFEVSGQILAFGSARPVGGVEVTLQGPTPRSTTTDANGQFVFANLEDANWSIAPRKVGRATSAVTAIDATLALRASVGLDHLSPEQRIAADTNGSGTLTAIDASLILQYRVGLITRLPVAQTCNSDWAFVPAPAAPVQQTIISFQALPHSCQMGAVAAPPTAADTDGQNFKAVLFGDVNGSWQPPATPTQSPSPTPPV